ncbi:mandelate racemase/muconate lactonizing enzyme family protein [candidate division KSB1 bacterium]
MKIKSVKYWTENLELTRPYTIAYQTIDSVENVFVRIDGENGLFGLGSASPADFVTGETFEDCTEALEKSLERLLIGKDICLLTELCRKLEENMSGTPAAMAAADIALHDLFAKYLKIPLVDLLGRVHRSMPTSITIGIKSVVEAIEEAKEYIDRKFKILKVKIGKSLEEDIEVIRKLRENVGNSVDIRVDANQGYRIKDLKKFFERTKKLNIEFMEQPLKADNINDMFELKEIYRKKIAADESLHYPADALKLSNTPHPFGIYNIKLMKCGGIRNAKRISEIAELAGIDLMWGCMDESIISISAALHAAFASVTTKYLDLDGSLDLARDIVEGGFELKDGHMTIVEKSGLGVTLV